MTTFEQQQVVELLLSAQNDLVGMPGALNGNKLFYTPEQKAELQGLLLKIEKVLDLIGYTPETEFDEA